MNLNTLRRFRFNLFSRISLPLNHVTNSRIHQLVKINQLSSLKQPFLCRINFDTELIHVQKRFAAKRGSKGKDDDTDSDDEKKNDSDSSDEESDDKNEGQILKIETINTRLDMMLKYTLKQTKAKIESFINEDKVRVNGQRIVKKSDEVMMGDVVDIINGLATFASSDQLNVTRVEYLHVDDKINSRGKYMSKVNVIRNLVIDNYEKAPYSKI